MIELRPYQESAIAALLKVSRGIVKAPAGSGKTVIAAAAIRNWAPRCENFQPKILWLAHTNEQCEQAVVATEAFFLTARCLVNVRCYQSGISAQGYDLVILDECHHIASPEFRKILDGYDGPRWGFSATPDRGDDLKDDVYALIGPIVYEVEREGLVETGKLAPAKVYFHAPNAKDQFKKNIEEQAESGAKKMAYSLDYVARQLARKDGDLESWRAFRGEARKELLSRATWHACQNLGVFENILRNEEIIRLAHLHSVVGDDSVLVLVGSIEHGKLLAGRIENAQVLHSKMGAKKRREAMEAFRNGALKCAIATSLADEGLDVPRANVLILAAAGRSEAKSEQRTGRVLRAWGEKTHGTIHDFWDQQHPVLQNQSRARARVYATLKYEFENTEILPAVLKAIGVKLHPAIGMTPPPRTKKDLSSVTTAATPASDEGQKLGPDDMPVPVLADENLFPSVQLADAELVEARESTLVSGPTVGGNTPFMRSTLSGGQKLTAKYLEEVRAKLAKTAQVPLMIEGVPHFSIDPNAPRYHVMDGKYVLAQPVADPPAGFKLQVNPDYKNVSEKDEKTTCRLHQPSVSSAPLNPPQNTTEVASTQERKHARMSPSVLKSKAICPGFFSDPDGDKTASDRGTLGHKAVEQENPDLCGEDTQLRAAVIKCIEYKHKIIRSHPVGGKGIRSMSQEIKLFYFDQWGFCDVLIHSNGHADLLDWKFAYNEYEADSPQFWAYCLGVWNEFPTIEEINVHVAHPFLGLIDVETFTRKEHYSKFSVEIKAIIASATLNDPATYRVNDNCAFCGFAKRCTKLAQLGLEIGRRYAPDLELPDHPTLHGSEITDPKIFAALLRIARPVKKAAEGWSKAALELHDTGTDIPGFKLMMKKGKRSIRSTKAAFDILKTYFVPDLTAEQFIEWCSVGATTLDEIVEKSAPDRGKKQARELLGAHLEDANALDHGGSGRFLKAVKEADQDE